MSGLQGAGNPGVETPIPIQVGDQGPLPSELQPKTVEAPVSAAPETAAAFPTATPEAKSTDGSPLDDALRQVDAAAGTARAVDAVVPPTVAAGLSVQGEGVKTAATKIASGDHQGLEADLVANNVVNSVAPSGEDQPEPEEAEVIPEKDEKEVAPELVVPAPPIVTASEPAEPSRPITTGEPPIDYHEPVAPPAEPLPSLQPAAPIAPPAPAMTIPQPPAPVAEVPNQAPVQPPAPAYPLNEPEVVMPKATGLPVPPDGGPVVDGKGMQQAESPEDSGVRITRNFEDMTSSEVRTIRKEKLKEIQDLRLRYTEALSHDIVKANQIIEYLLFSESFFRMLLDLERKKEAEEANAVEQGPVAA